MKTVSQILNEAADLLEPKGRWMQGDYGIYSAEQDSYTCLCLYGAICEAMQTEADNGVFGVLLGVMGLKSAGQAIKWNDAPERTQAEVVAKLREAAALADGALGRGEPTEAASQADPTLPNQESPQ